MAQAVEAATRTAGPAHPDTGRLLSYEALLLDQLNRPAAAEPLHLRSIAILEAPSLALPADLATALELYAAHLTTAGRGADASKLLERARPIRARRVREMAPRAEDAPAARPIGKDVSAPVVLYKLEPAYSDIAKLAKYQGGVLMKIEIGTDGNVRSLELGRGVGYGLDEKAAEALLKWKFKPGAVDGQPVPVKANVEINFRLQ
jgi:TonB family protein